MIDEKEINDVFELLGLKSERKRKKILEKKPENVKPESHNKVVIADNVSNVIEGKTKKNA